MGTMLYSKDYPSVQRSIQIDTAGDGLNILVTDRTGDPGPAPHVTDFNLNEKDVEMVQKALDIWTASRKTVFNVGDIVFEKRSERAAEVVLIQEDRVLYGAPYRVRYLHQRDGQPGTDYFAAEELALIFRKGEYNK